jgi:hypothetical protein
MVDGGGSVVAGAGGLVGFLDTVAGVAGAFDRARAIAMGGVRLDFSCVQQNRRLPLVGD